MKRLVYSPRVDVFVKADSGIIDLSPYVTDCSVSRVVNEVSHATVKFRNPVLWDTTLNRTRMAFTENLVHDNLNNTTSIEPMFHPMDPIVIAMTRLKDRPIQVFTGFCDKTPYLQLFPGPCTIEASCTLKRLQYTYFDPGLPFTWQFFEANGWLPSQDKGGLVSSVGEQPGKPSSKTGGNGAKANNLPVPDKLTDGSIGGLLFQTLVTIGGWDESTIYIENLPPTIVPIVENLFKEISTDAKQANQEFTKLLTDIIGTSNFGGGGGSNTGSSTATGGGTPAQNKELGKKMAKDMFGWEGSEWKCLERLWESESNWDQFAYYPSHHPGKVPDINFSAPIAYGIPQSRPGNKMASEGSDWKSNPATQIKWGLKYIHGTYGSPCATPLGGY